MPPSDHAASRPPAAVPAGHLVYAIGDVHGRADLLGALLRQIRKDAAGFDANRRTVIYLGDYIDRGPDSRGVVELALGGLPEGFETVCLMGNHEQHLLEFLRSAASLAHWRVNGADATFASYGVSVAELAARDAPPDAWRKALRAALPPAHLRFYETVGLTAVIGGYFFVHAGVRPHVPLDRQEPHDCLWIRDAFLTSAADFGKVVVHGHTPGPAPDIRANRIGIDTFAWASGRLTALRLWGRERAFLSTAGPANLLK